jgi:hypothetical protein
MSIIHKPLGEMKKDELAINIVGHIKPTFGRTFTLTLSKNGNGGYSIRDFPRSVFTGVEVDGVTDFQESWRKTYPDTQSTAIKPMYCVECGAEVKLAPSPKERYIHKEFPQYGCRLSNRLFSREYIEEKQE